jgi:hypothetical protein
MSTTSKSGPFAKYSELASLLKQSTQTQQVTQQQQTQLVQFINDHSFVHLEQQQAAVEKVFKVLRLLIGKQPGFAAKIIVKWVPYKDYDEDWEEQMKRVIASDKSKATVDTLLESVWGKLVHHDMSIRNRSVNCLIEFAQAGFQKDEILASCVKYMNQCTDKDEQHLIGEICALLLTTRATQYVAALRRAFMLDIVDLNRYGDWGDVLNELKITATKPVDIALANRTGIVQEGRRQWRLRRLNLKGPVLFKDPESMYDPNHPKCTFFYCDELETPDNPFPIK